MLERLMMMMMRRKRSWLQNEGGGQDGHFFVILLLPPLVQEKQLNKRRPSPTNFSIKLYSKYIMYKQCYNPKIRTMM